MKSSRTLIEKVKQFEGLRLTAYKDSAGVPTIGYGHTRGVRMGDRISMSQAERYLENDLRSAEYYVDNLKVAKTQGQFDALVDFVFNLGGARLSSSTLLRKIRAKASVTDIQNEFRRWVFAGGKVQPGLVKRRAWEAKRYAE